MSSSSARSGGLVGFALATAFILASIVVALPFPSEVDGAFSRLFSGALPWIALAGLPRAPSAGGVLPRALLWTACALATSLVAARLDRLDGRAPAELWIALLALTAAVFLLALAAERARGGTLHAVVWTLAVPLAAFLAAASALFDAEAVHSTALVSPLALAWELAVSPDTTRGPLTFSLPFLTLVVLAVLPARPRAREHA